MQIMEKIKNLFDKIYENKSKTYFVHYSCQSLKDDNEGYSARITSIAVLHFESSQMSSFSMHLSAEELEITRNEIEKNYDKIEKEMLLKFNKFLEANNENTYWIHWNMTNINYGFEAIEHRYKILTKTEMQHIPEINRFNLSNLLKKKYGTNYANDPKLINLMEMNGGKDRNFLSGEEEVRAYKANEFVKLHNSTMCKVYFFRDAFYNARSNKLRTKTNQFRYKVNELYQNPIVQILGIVGIIGTLVGLFITIIKKS